MNYERLYTNLMLKCIKRQTDNPQWMGASYVERHHWYPRALYPEWEKESWNIVVLTAREHFLAHWMLYRFVGKHMATAFWMMCVINGNKQHRYIPSSTAVAEAREAHSQRTTERQTGVPLTAAHRAAISAGNAGKVVSAETRAKLSRAKSSPSAETRAKISASLTGNTLSAETRAKISAAAKGRVFSDQHCANISKAHKGKVFTKEHCENIARVRRGKSPSAETREKLRISNTGRKHAPETIAKVVAMHTGSKRSEESKARMAAASYWLGRGPWETTNGKKYLHLWELLADLYEWWEPRKDLQVGSGHTAAAKHFGYTTTRTWWSMIEWLKKNGNPNENVEWSAFHNNKKGI